MRKTIMISMLALAPAFAFAQGAGTPQMTQPPKLVTPDCATVDKSKMKDGDRCMQADGCMFVRLERPDAQGKMQKIDRVSTTCLRKQ